MYHTSTKTQESKSTQAADWRGVRHARMSKSMFQLPPGAFKVLAGLRCALKDGETRTDVSQAAIAELADVSEATVSRAMPILRDAGYISWEKNDPNKRGRGAGHTLTMLPPPELSSPAAQGNGGDPSGTKGSATRDEGSDVQGKGSFLGDAPNVVVPLVATPQNASQEGSTTDPCIFLIHAIDPITTTSGDDRTPTPSGGGGGGATRQTPAAAAAPELTEAERLLIEFGVQPVNARKLAHLDPAAVRAGLKEAARHNSGPGSVVNRWLVCPPKAPASALPPPPTLYRPTGNVLTPAERAEWARNNNPFAARGDS